MTLVCILKYNFECFFFFFKFFFANRVTGSWTHCIHLLNFVFAKSLVGIKLFG